MNSKQFDQIVDKRLSSVKEILSVKAKEYRRNDDPFHNFEIGAKMTNVSSFRVLDGFLLKHLISYRDMMDDIDNGKLPSEELVNEKFGDIINYFIIQEAQFKKLINK
tara:strand:- start:65665 stop:65985 length:321 start_codon:yes stop_codon:yes gene_type:complete